MSCHHRCSPCTGLADSDATSPGPGRVASPQVFVYWHIFQTGDLPIWITDTVGNPVDPATISFTIFTYVQGQPVQVGAADRKPVKANVGEYYVVGVAGEGGQPGDWFVRWHYRQAPNAPTQEAIFPFKVVERILPSEGTVGAKYGW